MHSFIDGHLDCFHILTFVPNATVNNGLPICFQENDFISFCYIPRSGIAISYSGSIFKGFKKKT